MQSPRGMKDILPEEVRYWQYIYDVALQTFNTANYHEIRTPILEETLLFNRSIGEGTDIVNKEMYNFTDQGKRELSLRPEGTAGIARAITQHKLCEAQSIQKLWYLGPMFRYERPQYGRQRQFHQLGLECHGSNHPMIDAEIIYLATTILQKCSCKEYTLEINSIGSNINRETYVIELTDHLKKYYDDLDLESKKKLSLSPIKILDSKNQKIQEILVDGPCLNKFLDKSSINHFVQLQEYLDSLNIAFKVNYGLVRGLDYYNDTVFEIKTNKLGSQDTICGGGRYNSLVEQIGGKETPSIGWGIGIERLLLLIKDQMILTEQPPCIYIAVQANINLKYVLQLIPKIHKHELKYELDTSNSSIKKQLQRANKKQSMACIIIGENEIINQNITIKWLHKYKQDTYKIQDFLKILPTIKKEYNTFIEANKSLDS
uniref:Histidine--tRNA ligase, chloroplastic n=1 Tax=Scinaia undulata TaxID=1884664 RepID=A0A1G4NY96_9FLOR|nr:Histidine-tRNA ligase [Scinaia undulata]SCW23486.1 Histidine-tRNA ligase [Scinaia undulata]